MWSSAHLTLFVLDLSYPAVCRVLFQYATCRNLQTGPDGGEGWWLEGDYSVECYTDRYWTWVPVVTISALVFAFGVPFLFGYLLYHYKDLGKAGDPVVQKALGWMCTFELCSALSFRSP